MLITIRYKEQKVDASGTVVAIRENINNNQVYRSFDPQSGSRLIFTPEYSVKIYLHRLVQELKMTMDEVHEMYPWFFED